MRRALIVGAALLLIAVALFLTWAVRATPVVRDRVVAALNDRFDSKVDLEALDVAGIPRPRVSGSGLTLRHNGRTDVPPLITVGTFDASANLRGLIGKPLRLHDVTLEGLEIRIPVGGLNGGLGLDAGDAAAGRAPNENGRAPEASDEPRRPEDPPPPPAAGTKPTPSPILIDTITSRRGRLEIASKRPGRLPRTFELEDLVMRDFGDTAGSTFHAGVINPIPKGRVETSGTFGPWQAEDPRLTPIRGEYAFKAADLDVIKGIGGTLSSVGTYKGVLQRIEVEGQTETPDFMIDLAGQKVPLSTRFTAIVDGTNGDTWLERVEAKLLQSTIVATGAVVRTEDVKGRRVALDIKIAKARIEDILRLAVNTSSTPLVGQVQVDSKFLLPTGEGDVIDRLQLDGRFSLAQATFTNIDVQRKINLLSSRGRGDEQADGTGRSVVSNLRGHFVMRRARLTLSELQFQVPGALIQLAGTYDLHRETMDFNGYFMADASLADMTSGVKALVARIAQPLFRRPGGGTRVPIKITGQRSNPQFGLDARRVFRRG